MTGLLYTHFHDNINFLNNPSYLKSEKPVCCINFLQQLTLYRLSLKNLEQNMENLEQNIETLEQNMENLEQNMKNLD